MTVRPPGSFPKYVLVLFTRHGDGIWYFVDVLGKAGRDWEGAWQTEVANQRLIKAKKKHADKPGLFELEELFASEPVLGAASERHVRAAVRALHVVGEVANRIRTAWSWLVSDRIPARVPRRIRSASSKPASTPTVSSRTGRVAV